MPAGSPPNGIPRIPELEGDYELVRELGRGGTAIVYLARDRDLGRDVAIKLIRPTHLQDDDALARLVREARTVGKLQHPNIVMLLGTRRLGEGGLALILQYVPGRTLKARIREDGPLPFSDSERILRDLGRALAYAHRRRIVHRDIKPENVYLDDDAGIARLADFGIARAWDSDSGLTLPGTAIGTPTYMSPEQVDGGDLDGRSDLYGLGLLAWEMLTGHQPWAGESLYSVIYKQKHEELPDLAQIRPDTPANLRRVVAGALRKDRDERWSSADEFLNALSRNSLLASEPPAIPRTGPESYDWERHRPVAEDANTIQYRRDEGPIPGGQGAAPGQPGESEPPPPTRGISQIAERRRRRQRLRRGAVLVTLLLLVGGGAVAVAMTGAEGQVRSLLAQILPLNEDSRTSGIDDEPYGTWQPEAVSGGVGSDAPPLSPGATELPGTESGAEAADAGTALAPPPGSRIAILQGTDQEAPAGRPLGDPIVLRIEGPEGEALEGIAVVLSASGGGAVSPGRAVTDPEGFVSAVWTVGAADADQSLSVALEADPEVGETLTARATPRTPALLRVQGGAGQEGEVGQALSEPLAIQVTDQNGGAIPGVWVRFQVVEGEGTVDPDSAETDASGTARTRWTLGGQQGPQRAVARVTGAQGLETPFSAEATPPRLPTRNLVASGGTHTCRLDGGGGLVCWGDNGRGQLGDGGGTRRASPGASVPGSPFVWAATGLSHTCALDPVGRAYCWGENAAGQLGDGTTTRRAEPTPVTDAPLFVEIGAGESHTCGRTRQGEVYCWGANGEGQLGDGSASTRSVPTRVDSQLRFRGLAVGWRHTCAIDTQGTVHCWGTNTAGELGRSTLERFPSPARVAGGHTFVELSAGNAHTCGLTSGGGILCWGANGHGQLGDGTTETRRIPGAVEAEGSFTAVTAGAVHTCALSDSGAALCWGRNLYGQIGDGTTTDRAIPTEVEGSFRFDRIDAFGSHTCGRTPGGDLLCWGYNAEGQLGDGTRQNRSAPVAVGGGGDD